MKARATAAVIVLGAALLLLPRDTAAHHRWFLVDNPWHNNGGMTTDYGYLWGGNIAWIHQGKSLGVCNDWGWGNYFAMPQGIRDAIASWEPVISGLQFSQGCGLTGYGLNFVRRGVTSGYACLPTWAYGCTVFAGNSPPPLDSTRKAHYPHSLDVWFNIVDYTNWTDTGYKATAAHELGHVFGLDEQYCGLPDHCSCPPPYLICQNSANVSVMDVAISTGHLDGVYAPTSDDITKVSSFFWPMPVQPYVTSYGFAPGVLYLNFTDLSYVESTYHMEIYRCCVHDFNHFEFAWDHAASVGKRNVTNGIPWYRASTGSPPGYYSMCGHTFNTVSGYMHYFCMNSWFYVS